MNIVLIGYRGTGKTVVGKKLARTLNRQLIGTDALITKRARMSIPTIVQTQGWTAFRDLESKVVKEVGNMNNCVIDTGGGVIVRKSNIKHLKKKGILILLKADVPTIINRIKGSRGRPSLTERQSFTEEVEEVLQKRRKRYEEAADYVIDTTELTVDEVTDRILRYVIQEATH